MRKERKIKKMGRRKERNGGVENREVNIEDCSIKLYA